MASAWGKSWSPLWGHAWGVVTGTTTPETDTHDGFTTRITSKPKRKKFERLWEDLMALYEELSAEAVAPVPMTKPMVADYVKPSPVLSVAVSAPPVIDWAALNRDMTRLYLLIEQNRKLIEDEDEDEAVMLLLM